MKEQILEGLLKDAGIESLVDTKTALPHGVTAHSRTDGEHTYLFVENYSETERHEVPLKDTMLDLLSGETAETITLPPYSFRVLKSL